jgi:hypothetical protein
VTAHRITVEPGTVVFVKRGDLSPRETPVYIARCACGWQGKAFRVAGDALSEGARHAVDAPLDEREHGDG